MKTTVLSEGRIASHQSKCKEGHGRGEWCTNLSEKGIILLGIVQGLAYEWGKELLVLSWQNIRHGETESSKMWCYRGRISSLSLASKEKNWHKMRRSSSCGKMKRGWRNSEEWAQRIILVVAF